MSDPEAKEIAAQILDELERHADWTMRHDRERMVAERVRGAVVGQYDRGYEDAKNETNEQAYNDGYEAGIEDGRKSNGGKS